MKEWRYIEAAEEMESHCNTHEVAATHCNSLQRTAQQYKCDMGCLGDERGALYRGGKGVAVAL